MINKSAFNIISVFSALTGAIIAIPALIPAFVWIAFLVLMLFTAPFILIYLKRLNVIKEFEMQKSLTIGAISGASACIGFSIIFFPIAFLINLIFKAQAFIWVKVLFTNFVFLISMVFMLALLCALLNVFSAFLVVYFSQYFGSKR